MSSANNPIKVFILAIAAVAIFFVGCITTLLYSANRNTNYFYPTVQHTSKKGTIAFIFDDAFDTDKEVIQIFTDHNLRCGFALVGSKISLVKKRYLKAQDDGFEILSHSHEHDYFTISGGKPNRKHFTDSREAEFQLRKSYQELVAAGFNIRGWVTPYSAMNPDYLPIVKKYYEFAFTVFSPPTNNSNAIHGFNTELRSLSRMSMESNDIQTVKAQIDSCISQKKLCVFYAHKLNLKLSEDGLKDILDYASQKRNALELDVLTPGEAINKYFAIDHEDLISK